MSCATEQTPTAFTACARSLLYLFTPRGILSSRNRFPVSYHDFTSPLWRSADRSSGNVNPQTGKTGTRNGKRLPPKGPARIAEEKKVHFFLPHGFAAFCLHYPIFNAFPAIGCRFGRRKILLPAAACHRQTVFIRCVFERPKEGNMQPDLLSVARSDSRLVRKGPAYATVT